MIKRVTIINHLNERLVITLDEYDPDHGLLISSISGLGPTKGAINTTPLAIGDGAIFNSAKAELRNIVLSFILLPKPTIEDTRQLTYKYFPVKKKVTLIIDSDNRSLMTEGYVETNEPNIFSQQETVNVSIVCPDAYFYASNGYSMVDYSKIQNKFEFPLENYPVGKSNIEFSIFKESPERSMIYEGDVDAGMIITIHVLGSFGNFKIYNPATREILRVDMTKLQKITGGDLQPGDDIVINTERNSKGIHAVKAGVIYNVLNALDRDSDWLILRHGYNSFVVHSDANTENMGTSIIYKTIYQGL